MNMTEIGLTALQVVAPVAVAAATWAAAQLAAWITAKVKNEYLSGVLTRLDDAVLTAVKEIEQTIVADIKTASADGTITDAEAAQIKASALDKVKSYLGPKGVDILVSVLGLTPEARDQFLGARIEATVHDLRADARADSTAHFVVTSAPIAAAHTSPTPATSASSPSLPNATEVGAPASATV